MNVQGKWRTEFNEGLTKAVELWGRNDGETTEWARSCLRSLLAGELSELELAEAVYARLKPVNSKGERVSPKLRNGRLTVRNLENSSLPVAGAAAARKSLEAVLRIYRARDVIEAEIEEFLRDERKLYGLEKLASNRATSRSGG